MTAKTVICLSLAFLLSVCIGLYGGNLIVANMKNKDAPIEKSDIVKDDLSDVLSPINGTPLDYDVIYNFRYAKKKMMESGSVETKITGNVTSMGMENQTVNTIKQFDGANVFFQSTSEGTFAKVYSRTFYSGGDTLHRTDKYSGGKWGNYEIMTTAAYLERFGNMPRDFMPYIVTKDTVIDSGVVQKTDAGYVFKLVLNDNAAVNYKRYVLENAGSLIMPVFAKIELTVTLDETWNFISILYDEQYKVKKSIPVLGTMEADCVSLLTEVYNYKDVKIYSSVNP